MRNQIVRSGLIAFDVTCCLAVLHGVPFLTCFFAVMSVYAVTLINTVWALSEGKPADGD